MNKIDQYLSEFDDFELAFFAKYKLHTYLPATQRKIEDVLLKRGMSNSRVESLIEDIGNNNHSDHEERCPRCKSDKIRKDRIEKDYDGRGGIFGQVAVVDAMAKGKANYDFQIICNVCGFWLKDPNEEKPKGFINNFISRLFNF